MVVHQDNPPKVRVPAALLPKQQMAYESSRGRLTVSSLILSRRLDHELQNSHALGGIPWLAPGLVTHSLDKYFYTPSGQ